MPVSPQLASKQLQVRARAALFDNIIEFVRLAGMLAFLAGNDIYLPAPWLLSAQGASYPEQNQLCHIAEVETDAAPIGTAILTDLVPHKVRFISKSPLLHHLETFGQQRIRNPEI